jgi:hypothetical protein
MSASDLMDEDTQVEDPEDEQPFCETCEDPDGPLYIVWTPGAGDHANFMCEGCLAIPDNQSYLTRHRCVIYKIERWISVHSQKDKKKKE